MHGQGTLIYPGGFKWIGGWKDDKMYTGKGTMIFRQTGSRYDGQMKNGKLYGSITITYTDGSKFEGNLISGKKYVQGTITYPDGKEYNKTLDDGFLLNWL